MQHWLCSPNSLYSRLLGLAVSFVFISAFFSLAFCLSGYHLGIVSSVHPLQTHSSSRTAAFADCSSRVCAALREGLSTQRAGKRHSLETAWVWHQVELSLSTAHPYWWGKEESNSRCRQERKKPAIDKIAKRPASDKGTGWDDARGCNIGQLILWLQGKV